MAGQIQYIDWGVVPYAEAWELQQALFNDKIAAKMQGAHPSCDFILVEHLPVYTLGKHGKASNMLLSEEALHGVGAELYHIDRGGDITYHGPGQITGYPIFDLEQLGIGLKQYIYNIEEVIIRVLADYGIQGFRINGATGVWVMSNVSAIKSLPPCGGDKRGAKICAIGVRASRYVTMHGFALNVNTDLRYFSYINPCGFTDKGVTSLQQELGHEVPIEEVKQKLYHVACEIFTIQ